MAGAFSLFLGMLGLGAAGAVSAGQNAKIKKADYQYGEEHGLHGTSEVLQMRERSHFPKQSGYFHKQLLAW